MSKRKDGNPRGQYTTEFKLEAVRMVKRHGTINLFAALNVATGVIQSKVTAVKKRCDFQAFMDDVIEDIADTQEVHVILDNYATHKSNDDWLARHPNVRFHFTPTSASWLNKVEIWFGIFTRKSLRGASFDSTEKLTQAIEAFVTHYNKTEIGRAHV